MRQVCNLAYAWLRADLAAALAMASGKERQRALDDFDLDLNAPAGGWETVDKQIRTTLLTE